MEPLCVLNIPSVQFNKTSCCQFSYTHFLTVHIICGSILPASNQADKCIYIFINVSSISQVKFYLILTLSKIKSYESKAHNYEICIKDFSSRNT